MELIDHRSPRLIALILLSIALGLGLPGCGGQEDARESKASRAADGQGKPVIAVVPKVAGSRYFELCFEGMQEAAKGKDYQLIHRGPERSEAELQVSIIEDLIEQRVTALLVSCNDPGRLAPVLQRARDAGILVVTYDADTLPEARDLFVNQATGEQIGRQLADNIAQTIGPTGRVGILTSVLTAPNQNEWIRWMRAQLKEKHPKVELVTIIPVGENKAEAIDGLKKMLTRHPDIDGVAPITSVALETVTRYFKENDLFDKYKLMGLPYPSQLRSYIDDQDALNEQPWNVRTLGTLTMTCVDMRLSGTPIEDGQTIAGVGTITYLPSQREVIMGLSDEQ